MGNKKFRLKQFHYHEPSEHLIDGRVADFETHFVHADEKGNLAVVGVLGKVIQRNQVTADTYKAIEAAPFGGEVMRILTHYQGSGLPSVSVNVPGIDLTKLIPQAGSREYFAYNGSSNHSALHRKRTLVCFQKPSTDYF